MIKQSDIPWIVFWVHLNLLRLTFLFVIDWDEDNAFFNQSNRWNRDEIKKNT